MQDDQPTFKVTDRRLFNADGTPRDLPPDEKTEPQAAAAASAPEIERQAPVSEQPTPSLVGVEDEQLEEEELEGANDPTSFVNFLMSIASNAATALGMMEHPVTHQREVDLQLGKHWIDIIGMLQKKTKGNVSKQEEQMVEGLLSDLRMQYVSLTNSPQKSRSFSGKDITGGR
ncbi:MAG TPA: DUF1844 domain-containing protein [Pyrinomonadaceae bacterium]|nr:DUF1844 domain-containing protein [Pyrinomonadaceae bacterium]